MKKGLAITTVVLVILVIFTTFHMIQQNSFNVYYVTTSTNNEELILEDLMIISKNNQISIDSYTLSKNSDIKTAVTDIEIEASINNQAVLMVSLTDLDDDYSKVDSGEQEIIKNVKLSTDSVLNLKFKYTVDGVKTEFYEQLKLSDYQLSSREANKILQGHPKSDKSLWE